MTRRDFAASLKTPQVWVFTSIQALFTGLAFGVNGPVVTSWITAVIGLVGMGIALDVYAREAQRKADRAAGRTPLWLVPRQETSPNGHVAREAH